MTPDRNCRICHGTGRAWFHNPAEFKVMRFVDDRPPEEIVTRAASQTEGACTCITGRRRDET